MGHSQICLEQGLDRGTVLEDTFHGAFPPIREPEDGRVQVQVGEWRFELRVGLSQVCHLLRRLRWEPGH